MNGFKRFCYIVFAILGVLLLAALILPWVGPWTAFFTGLIAYDWYLFLIEMVVVILGLGFLGIFIKGCVTKKRKDIVLFTNDGDEVRITRAAIASQASYLVETDGKCYASKVIVRPRRNSSIDVKVYVEPHEEISVAKEAKVLQKRLRAGLDSLCAGRLNKVEISFTEPRVPTDIAASAQSADGNTETAEAAGGEAWANGGV